VPCAIECCAEHSGAVQCTCREKKKEIERQVVSDGNKAKIGQKKKIKKKNQKKKSKL
jgi:hypothetical protein